MRNYGPALKRPTLQPSNRTLSTYSGEELDVQGFLTVNVTYGTQQETLSLLVIGGNGLSLLGRGWLVNICLH